MMLRIQMSRIHKLCPLLIALSVAATAQTAPSGTTAAPNPHFSP
jgi:hypothetical protein